MNRRRLLLIVLLLALAAAAAAAGWWGYHQLLAPDDGASSPQRPPATVAAAPAERRSWHPYLRAVGSLRAVRGVEVTTEIAGQVAEIEFTSGARVEASELLLRLDASTDRARLAELRATLAQALAAHRRDRRLFERGAVAEEEVEASGSRVAQLRAQIAGQRALIEKKSIKAPFAGRLGIRQVNLGQYLSPGTPIVDLQQLAPIHVDFNLPERELGPAASGLRLEVRTDAWPQRVFEGEITSIAPRVDPQTRNFALQGTLPNDQQHLRPGLFADVTVILPRREAVLTVPQTAISHAPYGDSVFVVVDRRPQPPGASRALACWPDSPGGAGGASGADGDEAKGVRLEHAIGRERCRPQRAGEGDSAGASSSPAGAAEGSGSASGPELFVRRVFVDTGERRDAHIEIRSGLEEDQCVVTAGQLKLDSGRAVRIGEDVQAGFAEPPAGALDDSAAAGAAGG